MTVQRAHMAERSSVDSFMTPAPDALELATMRDELVNHMQLPADKAEKWLQTMTQLGHTNVGQIKMVTADKVASLCFHCDMTAQDLKLVQVYLGTVMAPFEFPALFEYDMGSNDNDVVGQVKKKGGPLKEVAQMLIQRRSPPLTTDSYFPPSSFDKHQVGSEDRDVRVLRNMVVREVYEVCGDLYPSAEERKVILGGITSLVGAPDARGFLGHWDNWKEPTTLKRRKGTAVSDLEKARRTPGEYGVSHVAVTGRRPARPKRVVLPHMTKSEPNVGTLSQPISSEEVPLASTGNGVVDNENGGGGGGSEGVVVLEENSGGGDSVAGAEADKLKGDGEDLAQLNETDILGLISDEQSNIERLKREKVFERGEASLLSDR